MQASEKGLMRKDALWSENSVPIEQFTSCPHASDEKTVGCLQCKEVICLSCLIRTHHTHPTIGDKEIVAEIIKKQNNILKFIKDYAIKMKVAYVNEEERLLNTLSRMKESFLTQVKKHAESLNPSYMFNQIRVKDYLRTTYLSNIKNYNKRKDKIKSLLEIDQESPDFNIENAIEDLNGALELLKRLQDDEQKIKSENFEKESEDILQKMVSSMEEAIIGAELSCLDLQKRLFPTTYAMNSFDDHIVKTFKEKKVFEGNKSLNEQFSSNESIITTSTKKITETKDHISHLIALVEGDAEVHGIEIVKDQNPKYFRPKTLDMKPSTGLQILQIGTTVYFGCGSSFSKISADRQYSVTKLKEMEQRRFFFQLLMISPSGKTLIAVGGVDENWTVLDTYEIYDARVDAWRMMKNKLNHPRHSFCSIMFQGFAFVIAGRSKDDYLNSIERIEIDEDFMNQENNSWELLMVKNPTDFKPRKACSCLHYDEQSFIIFGGKPSYNTVLFNMRENQFKQVKELMLSQRDHFFTNVKLQTDEFTFVVSQLWNLHIFDKKERVWRDKIPIPKTESKPQINPIIEAPATPKAITAEREQSKIQEGSAEHEEKKQKDPAGGFEASLKVEESKGESKPGSGK